MNALSFYFKVIQALEEIEAPYMIVGAFAGLAFGVNRVTFYLGAELTHLVPNAPAHVCTNLSR